MKRLQNTTPAANPRLYARAFTLIDVLVSISVISILIGLLIPTLGKVNETARRVVCQSNVRQIGLGLIMYADDHRGLMPSPRFVPQASRSRTSGEYAPQRTVTLRAIDDDAPADRPSWDGLGRLFELDYIPAPKVFYCPSHWGENPYPRYSYQWSTQGGEIICNYHFRGEGPTHPGTGAAPFGSTTNALYLIDPAQSSLIADGMEVRTDYNHRVGVNFFRADLTVHWFDDHAGELVELLPEGKEDADAAQSVAEAWRRFDAAANRPE
jgi:type II secretory pathway pseudopilin PulG